MYLVPGKRRGYLQCRTRKNPPDSCVELVIHFRDPFLTHFPDGTSAIQPQSFVVGQMKRFLEIAPAGQTGLIAIRFLARGAYLFFQRRLSEVASGIVDLEDVWKDRARELTERVALASCMTARIRIIEEAMLVLLRKYGRYDHTVDRCLQLIETNWGHMKVTELAKHLGVSSRQLTRRFQHTVGLSPKETSSRLLCTSNYLKSSSNAASTAGPGEWSTPCKIRKRHPNETLRLFASSVAVAKKRSPRAKRFAP